MSNNKDLVYNSPTRMNSKPQKSQKKYEKVYQQFRKFLDANNFDSEEVGIEKYMMYLHRRKNLNPRTIKTIYSILKVSITDESQRMIDSSLNEKINRWINNQNRVSPPPKQAAVFPFQKMIDYLTIKSSDLSTIQLQAAMCLAIAGGCRCEELHCMHYNDLKWSSDKLEVTIRSSKVDQCGKGFSFYVLNSSSSHVSFYNIIKTYFDHLLPIADQNPSLFICVRNGKFIRQPVGINTLYMFPSKIATLLNLENSKDFTGHSFRRTFATIMASKGFSTFEIMKAGRWASADTAKRYIDYTQIAKFKSAAAFAFNDILKPNNIICDSNMDQLSNDESVESYSNHYAGKSTVIEGSYSKEVGSLDRETKNTVNTTCSLHAADVSMEQMMEWQHRTYELLFKNQLDQFSSLNQSYVSLAERFLNRLDHVHNDSRLSHSTNIVEPKEKPSGATQVTIRKLDFSDSDDSFRI
ncbi:hypothetical protein WA158_003933 [Blastocystis sp. Blastoise]